MHISCQLIFNFIVLFGLLGGERRWARYCSSLTHFVHEKVNLFISPFPLATCLLFTRKYTYTKLHARSSNGLLIMAIQLKTKHRTLVVAILLFHILQVQNNALSNTANVLKAYYHLICVPWFLHRPCCRFGALKSTAEWGGVGVGSLWNSGHISHRQKFISTWTQHTVIFLTDREWASTVNVG